ncbi:MAG TPA: hypothetical protein VJN93_03180 [Candidatus Acidoferrum sp.]|nr:hypothetical protein [Candidatus Acidoferrum sp.]
MIPAGFPRRLAVLLLEAAVRITPEHATDWGQAMLGELRHVEGDWSALVWSFGSAGVLAKHALIAMIFPGANRSPVSSGGSLFSKEGLMRKATLYATALCLLATLLLFVAPVFRQAFQVSLAQWYDIFHISQRWTGQRLVPELNELAKKAEAQHDAEGIAFVAVRYPDAGESVRLAEEAVRLNHRLIWVQAIVGVTHGNPEVQRWISELKEWDPQNALPHLMDAEEIDVAAGLAGSAAIRAEEKTTPWQNAMEAAFRSTKLDTYTDRLAELDRGVILRYQIRDPFLASSDGWGDGLPSYANWDSWRYAKSLLESGKRLEASGDSAGAAQLYLEIARFGQMTEPGGRSFFLGRETAEACRRLAAQSQRKGDTAEAGFYNSVAEQMERANARELAQIRSMYFGNEPSRWSALIARASGLILLLCGLILLTCAAGALVRSRTGNAGSYKASAVTLGVALGSAIGALLSSAMLYVSYRPYSQILGRFAESGDKGQLPALMQYLELMQQPLGARRYIGSSEAAFQFWCAVAILCALAAVIAVVRHLQTRSRVAAA